MGTCLRHNETVSAKLYDFGTIETSVRKEQTDSGDLVGKKMVEIDTESILTIEQDSDSTVRANLPRAPS